MKVKQLIKYLANVPADAEVIFVDKKQNWHYVDTLVGFSSGEKPVMHLLNRRIKKMNINEILCFIREAAEEKQEKEKLVRADWRQIDRFLDCVENFARYIVEN